MHANRLTQKSQEALQRAQSLALELDHADVDAEHLLLALLEPRDGLFARLLARLEVDPESLERALRRALADRPTVAGQRAEPDKVYITQRLQKCLVRAERQAERMQDAYVSIEHLALALIEEGEAGVAGRLLREAGVRRDAFLNALSGVPRVELRWQSS